MGQITRVRDRSGQQLADVRGKTLRRLNNRDPQEPDINRAIEGRLYNGKYVREQDQRKY